MLSWNNGPLLHEMPAVGSLLGSEVRGSACCALPPRPHPSPTPALPLAQYPDVANVVLQLTGSVEGMKAQAAEHLSEHFGPWHKGTWLCSKASAQAQSRPRGWHSQRPASSFG